MNYSALVLNHFFDPKNVGEIDSGHAIIAKGHAGSDNVGEKVELYLGCNSQGDVEAVRYKVYGNPYMIAVMSVLSEQMSKLPLADIQRISYQDLTEQLSIPTTKRHCALLAMAAVQSAVSQVYELMR